MLGLLHECENCDTISEAKWGYDDRNFHDNAIPAMKCKHCDKSRKELNVGEEYTFTKYPEGMQI